MRASDYRQGVAIENYTQENLTDEWWSTIFGLSVKAGTAAAIGDGLVGMNIRVPLSSDSADVPSSVVVKLASNDPTSRFTGITLRNYEREVKFYNNLAATVDIRTPRCFYADWHETAGDFVIVLEDMSPAEQEIKSPDANLVMQRLLLMSWWHFMHHDGTTQRFGKLIFATTCNCGRCVDIADDV